MRILRAIYRLDFPRNYEMINQPGTVARLIQEGAPKEFFDFYGEDRAARKIIAKRLVKDEARFRALTVEPATIVCDIERIKGIPIEALVDDPDFAGLCTVISSVLKRFEIVNLDRAGLRLFVFGSNGRNRDAVLRACKSFVSNTLLANVRETLGEAGDIGIAIDGASDAKVSYHLRVGPFLGPSEFPKYFSSINDLLPPDLTADTVIDLDLFENKFAFTAAGAVKWCMPQVTSASKISQALSEMIAREAGK